MNNKLIYLLILLLSASCVPTRNLVYFSDLKNNKEHKESIVNNIEPKIQPNDLLSITVSTLSPESNALFNGSGMQTTASANNVSTNNSIRDGYLVDKAGYINFPVMGAIKLAGLTKEEATAKIMNELKKYIKGNTIVNVRLLNFKITVIGEVNKPSSFTVPTEKINVLEALGMAGDMTAFGKRENVLIVRENDGVRSMTRINLNKKEVLSSPYFYLQQNDIVYVEPDKAKALQNTSLRTFYLPVLLAALSTASLIIFRIL